MVELKIFWIESKKFGETYNKKLDKKKKKIK